MTEHIYPAFERGRIMKKELLPLGSVVLLKNGTKRIMICGRLQQRESDQKIFRKRKKTSRVRTAL